MKPWMDMKCNEISMNRFYFKSDMKSLAYGVNLYQPQT